MTDVIIGLPGPIGRQLPVVEKRGALQKLSSHDLSSPPGKRPVTVIRDHDEQFPDMWLSIFIVGDKYEEQAFAKMFVRAACHKAKTIDEADIVVFTGGTDVDPCLYGHEAHMSTDEPDVKRDGKEMEIFLKCREEGIPMLGVCRGAQFLHVMHGGALYQDVGGHNRKHSIITTGGLIIPEVSSVHHQMIIPDPKLGIQILATSNVADYRTKWGGKKGIFEKTYDKKSDVEAFFYRSTCSLGIQGHPEYAGYPLFTSWVMEQIDQLIHCNPDCIYIGPKDTCRYRIKPELVAERMAMEAETKQTEVEETYTVAKPKKVKETLTVPSTKEKK